MKTPLEWLYALLALLGVVLPWRFNLAWMQSAEAASGLGFIEATLANDASTSIALDITIVFVAFSIWVVAEGRRLGIRHAWLFIPYAGLVALASAFPLFLLVRARRMRSGA